jgi:alkylation response protein AidB-like acyl-CoA dehydrogenase
MDLDFTPEQELLRETVRGLCARHASLTVVREMEDDPVGYPAAFWEQLGSLGLLGMTIPEEFGGSGMTMLDAAVVYTELGAALAPSPHFASSVLSAGLIARSPSSDVKSSWLPRIASGAAIITPAWLEPEGGYGPAGVRLSASASSGGGYVLNGVKRHVVFASSATRLLLLARDGDEVIMVLVDPAAPGVEMTQQMTVASDTQYRVSFDAVEVGPDAVVARGWGAWNAVMHDGIILAAAYAAGGARHALDITVQYSKDRHQFDKPLGAFQALAHNMADAVTAVDGAETLVYEAAWTRSENRSVDRLAPMAKLFACRVFRDVTAMAQQIFGGVGFTLDYDIQLYFRRAKQLELSWWDTRYLENLVAAAVLDTAAV